MNNVKSFPPEWNEFDTNNFGGGGGGAQSDWNQNDSTAADYIKNRPFYTTYVETVLVEESTVSFSKSPSGLYQGSVQSTFSPTLGKTYKVSWDGTTYESACVEVQGKTVFGNPSILGAGV